MIKRLLLSALCASVALSSACGSDKKDKPNGKTKDADGDGVDRPDDCNDDDANVWALQIAYADSDEDRYTLATAEEICVGDALPDTYAAEASVVEDCNDNNPSLHTSLTGFLDADTDGETVGSEVSFCTSGALPSTYLALASSDEDCDDGDEYAFHGAASEDPIECMRDADEDGYGDMTPGVGVTPGTDCDDEDDDLFTMLPGFVDSDGDGFTVGGPVDVCTDGITRPEGYNEAGTIPQDCDDDVDTVFLPIVGYTDEDGDGVGLAGSGQTFCTDGDLPEDYVDAGDPARFDCDDGDEFAYPGSAANDSTTACMRDFDGDNYGDMTAPGGGVVGSDCDDNNGGLYLLTTGYFDYDEDGSGGDSSPVCTGGFLPAGFLGAAGDCDDLDPLRSPQGFEIPDDGIDGDCDGGPDLSHTDLVGLYVSETDCETDVPPYGSSDNPYCSLTQAINDSENSGLIFVSGSYNTKVLINKPIALLGGYNRVDWTRGPSYRSSSTLSGNSGDPSTLDISDVDGDVVIEGFTVLSPSNGAEVMSTVAVSVHHSSVLLVNDVIVARDAASSPAFYSVGVLVEGASSGVVPEVSIEGCTVTAGLGQRRAAIAFTTPTRMISDTQPGVFLSTGHLTGNFIDSTASASGSYFGIFATEADLTIRDNTINENVFAVHGAKSTGIFVNDEATELTSELTLFRNTVNAGLGVNDCHGLRFKGDRFDIHENDINGCVDGSETYGVEIDSSIDGDFRRNDVWGGYIQGDGDAVGMRVTGGGATRITNNVIIAGSGRQTHALEVLDAYLTFAMNSVYAGNATGGIDPGSATHIGGAVWARSGSHLTLIGNALDGGTASGGGFFGSTLGLVVESGSQVLARGNAFHADFTAAIYTAPDSFMPRTVADLNDCSNLAAGCSSGTTGNLAFADFHYSDAENGWLDLEEGSPLIDAAIDPITVSVIGGCPSLTDQDLYDRARVRRPTEGNGDGGAFFDFGAYEYIW